MPMREAEAVLAEWRGVERELEDAAPGSPEEDRLQAHAATLRDQYQRLVEQAKATDSWEVPNADAGLAQG